MEKGPVVVVRFIRLYASLFMVCMFFGGCAVRQPVDLAQTEYLESSEEPRAEEPPREKVTPEKTVTEKPPVRKSNLDRRWSMRVITDKEISKLTEKDPELTPVVCMEILARLNTKARYYIPDDIKKHKAMKVPNNFSAYKDWTPLPRNIPEFSRIPKFILIVKDIPFIGWYQQGKLTGDTQIGIGKMYGWTKAGAYKVMDKDPDHVSTVYPNAYGEPSPMPFALRIYDRVWIHTGDVIGGYCSHGCINLPLEPSEQLYNWADKNTPVMIIDSMNDLHNALTRHADFLKSVNTAQGVASKNKAPTERTQRISPAQGAPDPSESKKIFSE